MRSPQISLFHNAFSFNFGLFQLIIFCFGSIETSKLAVLVKMRNNQNKCSALDSAETSFGSSFGCFEEKLVSLDTLGHPICLEDTYHLWEKEKMFHFSFCFLFVIFSPITNTILPSPSETTIILTCSPLLEQVFNRCCCLTEEKSAK